MGKSKLFNIWLNSTEIKKMEKIKQKARKLNRSTSNFIKFKLWGEK